MTILTDIPSDITIEILSEWIDGKVISAVDSAYCSHKFRSELLQLFKLVKVVDLGCRRDVFYKYVSRRSLCLTSLLIYSISKPSFLDMVKLSSVKSVDLRNSIGNEEINIVNRCINANSLKCCTAGSQRLFKEMTHLKNLTSLTLDNRQELFLIYSLKVIADVCRQLKRFYVGGYYQNYSLYSDIVKNNCNFRVFSVQNAPVLPDIALYCPHIEYVNVKGDVSHLKTAIEMIASRPQLKQICFAPLLLYETKEKVLTVNSDLRITQSDQLILFLIKNIRKVYFKKLSLSIYSGFDTFITNNCNTLISLLSGVLDADTLRQVLSRCALLEELYITYKASEGEEVRHYSAVFEECKPVHLRSMGLTKNYDNYSISNTYKDVLTILESVASLQKCRMSILAPQLGDEIKQFKSGLSELYNRGRSIECCFTCCSEDSEVNNNFYAVRFMNGVFERDYGVYELTDFYEEWIMN